MKKLIIGAIVGGIILFICQSLSWTILDLHRSAHGYTPKQTEIMNYLNSQLTEDGSYFLPNHPPGASREEMEQYMKNAEGQPWASISYHRKMDMDMGMNIFRNLLSNIVLAGLFCWILSTVTNPKFSTVFGISLITGIIVFLNVPYTMHIWYGSPDISAYLIDSVAGWGLAGLWFGWLYSRKKKAQ